MTVREAAAYLRVNVRTVLRLIERGELRAAKVGSRWRVARESVVGLVQGNEPGKDKEGSE